jgi:16S rRNA processing protein RimM
VPARDLAYVTLALVLRPQGRRGEVAAEILTDFPERLTKLKKADLLDRSSRRRSVAIRSCWISHSRGGQAIFHFEGSNSIDDAKTLVGCEVQIPASERVVLPTDQYYIGDLVGCEVFEGEQNVGVVRDVMVPGEMISGTPNLIVDTPEGELLIPLAAEICPRIDTVARRIEVVLPDGLREVNSRS